MLKAHSALDVKQPTPDNLDEFTASGLRFTLATNCAKALIDAGALPDSIKIGEPFRVDGTWVVEGTGERP